MAAQDPHWKLLLVGTGEMEPEMRAAAARRGLTDRVIFCGRAERCARLHERL